MTHLRMRAMVSFLSFPWNGSDPVSISNCRATQNRSKCSDQPPLPSGETQTGSVRPSSRGHSKSWSTTCGRWPTWLLGTELHGGLQRSVQRWMGGRSTVTNSAPRQGAGVSAGTGTCRDGRIWPHTLHGATEDPSFPGGCSGAAQREGGGGWGGGRSLGPDRMRGCTVDSESRADSSSSGQPSSFTLL